MSRRGWVSHWALVVLFLMSALVVIGLRARSSDLSWEHRSLDRACARWAAESAIARQQSRLRSGRSVTSIAGTLGPRARYDASARTVAAGIEVEAQGKCGGRRGRPSRITIRVRLSAKGTVLDWAE